jgi:hypothetical protein
MAVRAVLCNDPRSGCGRTLLSQLEFAKRAKVAQERNPAIETLKTIAKDPDVPVTEVLE